MNNKFKKILALSIATAAVTSVCALSACGGDDNPNDGVQGENIQIFEAELTDVAELEGSGWSGAPGGLNAIVKDGNNLGASNGYYMPYTWAAGYTITFEITAAEAVEAAKLYVRLASDFEVTHTPDTLSVKVNGDSIDYGEWEMPKGGDPQTGPSNFQDFLVGEVALIQGSNVIELVVNENDLVAGRNIGPAFDCIKIDTPVRLSMYNWDSNLAGREDE